MFITLLIVTFVLSILVCSIIAKLFSNSLKKILERLTEPAISESFRKYILFAMYVVGISSGVRIWELERYITPSQYAEETQILVLNSERWILEVYRTIIATLEGIAWMLLIFFLFTLIAYVIVKATEARRENRS